MSQLPPRLAPLRFVTADPVYLEAMQAQIPRLFQEYPKWVSLNGRDVLVNSADEEAEAGCDIERKAKEPLVLPVLDEPPKRKPGRPRKTVE